MISRVQAATARKAWTPSDSAGLINTTQQIGGALGLAVLAAVVTDRTHHLLHGGNGLLASLTGGFTAAFLGAALIALVAALVALVLVPATTDAGRARGPALLEDSALDR